MRFEELSSLLARLASIDRLRLLIASEIGWARSFTSREDCSIVPLA
jgi:hypothetical protein